MLLRCPARLRSCWRLLEHNLSAARCRPATERLMTNPTQINQGGAENQVYNYFWEWTRYGVLDRIHHMLLVKVRELEGREASPTAAIIDTQAVKATEKGGLRGIRSDTTRQRKPKASSAMSSSTRSGGFAASRGSR